DREKMNALLMGYYTGMIANLMSIGGPEVDPSDPISDFWDHTHEFLPPTGAMLIARQGDNWVGTGAFRALPGNRAELKRLYVDPKMRGTGLGRRLVTERVDIAREQGITKLVVDTITPTTEMQALYRSLGFVETGPYPESVSYITLPQIRDYLLFFEKSL
ncbi:MAG: GNAT family N-acetyltransferase, partial [Pseudomonadota bacterium]